MANQSELTELFRKLGAGDPAGWAHSQMTEDLPQLARFLFLRQAWKSVVPENDRDWIQKQSQRDPSKPGGAIAPALIRLKEKGVSEADLTTVVRVMQWQLLFELCYLLDDPGQMEAEVANIAWRLFQVDENDAPVALMSGLHESVLETEPSGREFRT